MPKTCINHKETPAATMCHQCHVPICTACSIVSPQGTFCSPECSVLNREFKSKPADDGPKGMPKVEALLKIVAAFILLWLGFYGIHVAAQKVPKLEKIDVVGRILRAFGAH